MMWLVKLALAISIVVFVQSLVMTKHKSVPVMDGFLSTSGYLAETWSRNFADCAYTCTKFGDSKSLFHVQKSGICQCNSKLFYTHTISNLTTVEGAKYYEMKGWKLDCPYFNQTFQDVELPDGTNFQYKVLFDSWLTFNESVAKCAEEGGHILQVTSPEKFEFTVQLAECHWKGWRSDDYYYYGYYYYAEFWIDAMYMGNSTNFTTTGWETAAGDPLPENLDYWYLYMHHDLYWLNDRWNRYRTHNESICLISLTWWAEARWYMIPCRDRFTTICEKV